MAQAAQKIIPFSRVNPALAAIFTNSTFDQSPPPGSAGDAPAAEPPAWRPESKLADRYRDIESDIYDIKNMAMIATQQISEAFSSPTPGKGEFAGYDAYHLPEWQRDTTIFSVFHVLELAEKLSNKYFEPFERKKGEKA